MRMSLGQASVVPAITAVAIAGPPLPANVGAAYQALAPYNNILVGLAQSGPQNTSVPYSCTPFSLPPGWSSLTAAQQATLLQPYQSLYSALPNLLSSAQTIDTYNASQGEPSHYTAMVQCAQQNLPQLFSAVGVTPQQPSPSGTGTGASTGTANMTPLLLLGGVAILLWVAMK